MTSPSIDRSQRTSNRIHNRSSRITSERFTLEQYWRAGRLQRYIPLLEAFFSRKRHELATLQAEHSSAFSLVELAKVLVAEYGVVDQKSEASDQLQEIETEIWIQGEQGNSNREHIAVDWATHHATVWRQWRLKEYLYTVEHMEPHLLKCLEACQSDEPRT